MADTRALGQHPNSILGKGLTKDQQLRELKNHIAFDQEQYLLEVWAKDGYVSIPGRNVDV